MFLPDFIAATIFPGVGAARMVDVEVAGIVCLDNGTVIGYDGEAASNTIYDQNEVCKEQ